MLLRQLKYFCSIVETGSFTEAVAQCFISQSAISQQIQVLERDLGVELLLRDGKPILRNYCAFWKTDNQNPYIKKFAHILGKQFQ